jgi:DNA-binding CsgD family transcriptional regulator
MNLTPRQAQVLELVQRGASNKQIAKRLNIGESTVKMHVSHLLAKYAAKTRHHLALTSMTGPPPAPLIDDVPKTPLAWVLYKRRQIIGLVLTPNCPGPEWKPVYGTL